MGEIKDFPQMKIGEEIPQYAEPAKVLSLTDKKPRLPVPFEDTALTQKTVLPPGPSFTSFDKEIPFVATHSDASSPDEPQLPRIDQVIRLSLAQVEIEVQRLGKAIDVVKRDTDGSSTSIGPLLESYRFFATLLGALRAAR